jgi:hypothetical protein
MDQARSVTATFEATPPVDHTLTVSVVGQGTVTSSPPGIDCGTDCSESYTENTVVDLTATPASGWQFSSWSGDCTGTGTCQVTMDQARSVTATFTRVRHTLTVTLSGTGGGTVTSSPVGIDCGTDCSEPYDSGTVVTLTPTADATSRFTGWSGACTGTGACSVTMSAARSVGAEFTQVVATIDDPSIVEGDTGTQGLVFTVTLTPAPGHPATVHFETANGSAIAGPVSSGGDYIATSSPPLPPLSFGPGDTQRTITVPVNGDLLAESSETFFVNLTATGAVMAPGSLGQGVGTILDNGDTCTHVGTAGDDTLIGSAGNDVLCGLGGDDTILAGTGDDLLLGGAGADVLLGSAGNDTILGGPGSDRVQGMEGNDVLDGEGGEDWLSYESASGVDVDTADINVFQAVGGGAGSDRLEEYFHNVAGSNGEDTIYGNHLANHIVANNGDDEVRGRDGADRLFGSENSDHLFGQAGNDHLNGGRNPPGDDRDICNGGRGTDTTDFCETTPAVP